MFLSAAPLLGAEDLQLFSRGLSAGWDGRCDSALQEAVSRLADRAEPTGHVVLILDKVSRPSLPTPPDLYGGVALTIPECGTRGRHTLVSCQMIHIFP